MKNRSLDTKLIGWLPRAACTLLMAAMVAVPCASDAQGRGGGRSDSGRSDSGRSDSGRSDSGRSDSGRSDSGRRDSGGGGSYRESPAPRRDDTPSRQDTRPREEYRAPRRDDTPSRQDTRPREEYRAPRRDDTPARRDDSYTRRDSNTPQRDETSPRRNDSAPRRDDTSTRRDDNAPRRDDTSTRRDTGRTPRDDVSADRQNRDRIDAGRSNPRDDINADRSTNRDARSRTGDRTSGTDRTRPGGSARPERDYRGDPYNYRQRRESDRNTLDRGTGTRAENARPIRDGALDIFSRSREGRRYNNGIVLRGGGYIPDRGIRGYFRNDYCYYPYYYPRFDASIVFFSPYSYYYDVCPPYIYRSHCHYYPPVSIWIDIPLYSGVDFRGWQGYGDDYYLDRRDYYTDPSRLPDRDLEDAVRDVREAFRFNNINLLANLTDPNVRIAVFLKGKYDYSVDASDYLDMTRDMFANTETIEFDLQQIHRRSADVWVASGRQVYLNRDNRRRAVYLSFVFERVHGRWTITQVGTAPDRIEEPRG